MESDADKRAGVSADGSDRIRAIPSITETDPEAYTELLANMDLQGSGRLDPVSLNPSIATAAAQLNSSLKHPGTAMDNPSSKQLEDPIPALELTTSTPGKGLTALKLEAENHSSIHDLD